MQLSTNFTTIFLAKSPRARGAWVPATSTPAGLGPITGRPRAWVPVAAAVALDVHAGYRTVDEQAAKVNYYSLYLPIYPSHNGCRMHLGIVSKRKDRHGQPYRSCRYPRTQSARPHAGGTRAPLRSDQQPFPSGNLVRACPTLRCYQALRRNSRLALTSSLIGERTSPMPKSRHARKPLVRSSPPMRLKGRRTFECAHASIVRVGNCSFAWRQSC